MSKALRIARVGIMSATFRGLIIGGMTGFILGVAGAFWWTMVVSVLTMTTGYDFTGAGYAMLVLLPLAGMAICGSLGMSVVFLAVLFYNITAGVFGGVAVEVEENTRKSAPKTTAAEPAVREYRHVQSLAETPSAQHPEQ